MREFRSVRKVKAVRTEDGGYFYNFFKKDLFVLMRMLSRTAHLRVLKCK